MKLLIVSKARCGNADQTVAPVGIAVGNFNITGKGVIYSGASLIEKPTFDFPCDHYLTTIDGKSDRWMPVDESNACSPTNGPMQLWHRTNVSLGRIIEGRSFDSSRMDIVKIKFAVPFSYIL